MRNYFCAACGQRHNTPGQWTCDRCYGKPDQAPAPIGTKHDQGKPRMSLVPQRALREVGRVVTFGAEAYGVENWKEVENLEQRFTDAPLRHINQFLTGDKIDKEMKCHHLACAITGLMFVLESQLGGVPSTVDSAEKES